MKKQYSRSTIPYSRSASAPYSSTVLGVGALSYAYSLDSHPNLRIYVRIYEVDLACVILSTAELYVLRTHKERYLREETM